MTDMFDPKVATGYDHVVAYENTVSLTDGFNTPWMVGITTDDTDYLFGLKNSGVTPFSPHPNVGYIVAVTQFNYSTVSGGPYLDNNLYAKYAWTCGYPGIDFGFGVGRGYLDSKYGTIAALNAAWGTHNFYTSFCDAGGYGAGTGVLDEDGRHTAWLGNNALTLTGASAGFVTDANQYVYYYALHYFTTAVNAIHSVDTHHMIFGPASLGAGGYEDRPQVLQALADAGIDVFQTAPNTATGLYFDGVKATYDLIHKPTYFWYALSANADSGHYADPGQQATQGIQDWPTQAIRGAHYASDTQTILGQQGSNGDYYALGIDFWEHTDGNVREKTNWGLVSDRDNAYDGIEDVNHQVTDSGGYLTVPEDRTYGDFITPVTTTNANLLQQLIDEWQH